MTKQKGNNSEYCEEEELNWAEKEFVRSNLGDRRLNERLIKVAEAFSKQPSAQIPQATGDWASTKGAYRFFSNTKVTPEKVNAGHRESTKERIEARNEAVVLAIQDTTLVDYTSHSDVKGLGKLGRSWTQGLILHPTLVASTQGIPLGIIHQQIWARTQETTRHDRKTKPIEEKESFKWIASYRASNEFQKECKGVQVVNICDREGDIYELFLEALAEKGAHLLVRSSWDRRVAEGDANLWKHVRSQAMAGTSIVEIPRKPNQKARQVALEIRYCSVEIKAPHNRSKKLSAKTLKLWAVLAEEVSATDSPVSWMLITTLPVNTVADAIEKVRWYTHRWLIERFFKVLKSGCAIEARQLEAAHRLKGCLAIDCIIAWRILFLTLIGRELPTLPASVLFEDFEWKALYCFVHTTPDPPPKELSLKEVIDYIAKLGGFLGRASDGAPGMESIWKGMWRLNDIAATWTIFNKK